SSIVWLESKDLPISGSATFATERFRFATPATRISETRTSPARAGTTDGASPEAMPRASHGSAADVAPGWDEIRAMTGRKVSPCPPRSVEEHGLGRRAAVPSSLAGARAEATALDPLLAPRRRGCRGGRGCPDRGRGRPVVDEQQTGVLALHARRARRRDVHH